MYNSSQKDELNKKEVTGTMDSIELKVAMKRNKDTLEKLAEALGLQVSGVWARVNGQTEFRAKEIKAIRQRYNLSAEDTVKIFL